MGMDKQPSVCQSCGWPLDKKWFDDARRAIRKQDGRVVAMTKTRWHLLAFLRAHPGQVILFERLWNHLYIDRDDPPCSNTLRIHICHLRRDLSGTPYKITTRSRQGYVFDMERTA